jgi:glycosyltransferase involved in cell wall biosynthesis
MPLKVVLAEQYPFETDKFPGGVHTAGYYLARGLQARDGVDVRVLTVSGQAPHDMDRVDDGLRVRILSEPRVRLIPNMGRNIKRLTAQLREMKPDIVNANMVIYAVAALRAGIPTVFTVHGVVHREAQVYRKPLDRLRYSLYMNYDREAMSQVGHIIATSPYVVKEYDGHTGAEFHVIDNCIDERFFSVPNNEEPDRLLFGGVIYDRKNVLGLLEITRKLVETRPNLKLRVAGKVLDEVYNRQCIAFVKEHGLAGNVDFLGQTTIETMIEELSRATMLLLPSKQETAPLIISEALGAGKPVIASTAGGIANLVSDGRTGYVADWRDNDRFIECIDRLLGDDKLREQMGKAARAEALSRFSKDVVAAQTVKVYERVLADRTS